jgi:tetratricopeptide (TPR) repeat protein
MRRFVSAVTIAVLLVSPVSAATAPVFQVRVEIKADARAQLKHGMDLSRTAFGTPGKPDENLQVFFDAIGALTAIERHWPDASEALLRAYAMLDTLQTLIGAFDDAAATARKAAALAPGDIRWKLNEARALSHVRIEEAARIYGEIEQALLDDALASDLIEVAYSQAAHFLRTSGKYERSVALLRKGARSPSMSLVRRGHSAIQAIEMVERHRLPTSTRGDLKLLTRIHEELLRSSPDAYTLGEIGFIERFLEARAAQLK